MSTKNTKLTKENLKNVHTLDDLFDLTYGKKGTKSREEFDAKAEAFVLAEKLKYLRKEVGLTQKGLSEKTGLEKSFISRVENGKVDVQISTLLKLLQGLGKKLQFV